MLIVLFNIIVVSFQVHAMSEFTERMWRLNISKPSSNYFTLLPEEIQNEIAHYLLFNKIESDWEFVERTKGMRQIKLTPNGEVTLCSKRQHITILDSIGARTRAQYLYVTIMGKLDQYFIYNEKYCASNQVLCSIPPDSKTFGVYNSDGCSIINLQTKEKRGPYLKENNESDLVAFALSSGGDYIAVIQKTSERCATIKLFKGDALCQELTTEIPLYCVTSIAFNKQSTKLIVRSKNASQIIPIVSKEVDCEKSKKNLIDYFRQCGVCKKLQ